VGVAVMAVRRLRGGVAVALVVAVVVTVVRVLGACHA
jgi:hypothetical protein